MPISYLACFSGCIGPKILRARALVWPRYSALFRNTEAKSGPKRNWIAARRSISLLGLGNIRRRRQLRLLEVNCERIRRHFAGGRQPGRPGAGNACTTPGKAGQQHLRSPRWRRGAGLPVLPGSFFRENVRSPTQAGVARLEAAQDRWVAGPSAIEERSPDPIGPGGDADFVEGGTRPGRELQVGSEQFYPEAGGLRPVPQNGEIPGHVLADGESTPGSRRQPNSESERSNPLN